MRTDQRRQFGGQLLFGAIVITIGIVFMLQNIGVVVANDVLRWWPLLLIAAGVFRLIVGGQDGSRFWGVILLAAGLIFVPKFTVPLGWGFELNLGYVWWPLLLIGIGGFIIWKGIEHRRAMANAGVETGDGEEYVNGSAVMGAWERRISSRQFRGGELNTMMGGIDLDLRAAAMAGAEARLSVSAFMGGIKIRIPQGWAVDARVTPFMGGVEDNSFTPQQPGAPLLIVTGTAFMGGVEIGN
ncbi:MAG: hypothetical protein IPP94_10900 [Ignavibacteria bacterium]|nr:hypothetical protein [Ignavibacteria bacterium]